MCSVMQSEGFGLQATSCSEELQCCQSEILELRCKVKALEVELQAQHNLVRICNKSWEGHPCPIAALRSRHTLL